MLEGLASALRGFSREAKGSVAILFGVVLIPILLAVGASVDYGRALLVRERMADAADSAALAVGSWPGLSQAELRTKAQQYFNANYPASQIGTPGQLNVAFTGNTITVTVSGTVPTTFMRLANINNMNVAASSTVTVGMGTLEVAIVLDNSGSMAGTKIEALKEAANDLVDALFAAAQYSNKPDPIKIAVVPFAGSVNVGSQYSSATWMDTGAKAPNHADSMKAYGAPASTNNFTLFNSLKDSAGKNVTWAGCVEARPTPYDVNDTAPTSTIPSTYFVPLFSPDEPDHWTCTTSLCSTACNSSSCGGSTAGLRYYGAPTGARNFNNYLPDAGEASTCSTSHPAFTVTVASPAVFTSSGHGLSAGQQIVFSTSNKLPNGLTAGTVYYVISSGLSANNFRVSTSSGGTAVNTSGSQSGTHRLSKTNDWTCNSGSKGCGSTSQGQSEQDAFGGKSIPAALNCKYGTSSNKATVASMTVGGIPGGPNFMCSSEPLLPLSTNKTTIKARINGMVAEGATAVGEGAMWGWRVLSPGAPFTEGRAYNADENQKVLVLMTDGANTYYPQSKFLRSWYGLYGYVVSGWLGTTSTTSSVLTQAMDQRTIQACNNIKAAGITIYAVGFEITGTGAAAALAVLQDCASDKHKYFAPNSEAELLASFNAIGKSISELRISK